MISGRGVLGAAKDRVSDGWIAHLPSDGVRHDFGVNSTTRGRSMKILRTSATVTAMALAGLAIASAPAGAAPNAPAVVAANSQSTGFAGYAVGGKGGAAVKSASTAFTLPSVTCPATGNKGVVLLAQVFSSTSSPTTDAVGGVFVVCESGTLIFQNLLEVNGTSPTTLKFTPVAKDKITVSVTQTSTGAKVIVKDLTQVKSQTYTGVKGSSAGTDDNSNIGDNAVTIGGTAVGNPRFGTSTFSKDLTNGVAIGPLPHTAYNEATAATGGKVRILTSSLNTAGNSFKTTYKAT